MSRLAVVVAGGVLVGSGLLVDQSGAVAPTAIDGPATATQPAVRRPVVDSGRSMRFFGTGSADIDRVKVALGAGTLANVGATDLTIEFWLKGAVAQNTGEPCSTGDVGWIAGNVVVDRDVYGPGDRGDFGVSLAGGRVAWGASVGGAGATVCTTVDVLDGAWHHVAVARLAATGRLQVWIDGSLAGTRTGPAGDASYRVGRPTSWPRSTPRPPRCTASTRELVQPRPIWSAPVLASFASAELPPDRSGAATPRSPADEIPQLRHEESLSDHRSPRGRSVRSAVRRAGRQRRPRA